MEGAIPPPEWLISRVCEEFGCLPSEAVRELMEDPTQLALDILELRAYARAKAALEQAERPEDVPRTRMVEEVWGVLHELLRRKRAGAGLAPEEA